MTIATTGQDVAEETRAFNDQLTATLEAAPPLHEAGPPEALRQGTGPFPESGIELPEPKLAGVNRDIPGNAGNITLRVFTPPVVGGAYLHFHGGGRMLGGADQQDAVLADLACAAEVAVLSVEYRLAPENPHPAGVEDCVAAARWLAQHADREFGTDRLVIGGESAGADLATHTLLRLRDRDGTTSPYRAANLVYGIYDMSLTPSARAWGPRNLVTSTPMIRWFNENSFPGLGPDELRDPDISALYADLRGLPQARFVVGTQDALLDDTLFMAQRWRAAGNDAELEVVAEAAHGFTLFPLTIAQRELARQHTYVARAVRA